MSKKGATIRRRPAATWQERQAENARIKRERKNAALSRKQRKQQD
jgi:hypothetical protein